MSTAASTGNALAPTNANALRDTQEKPAVKVSGVNDGSYQGLPNVSSAVLVLRSLSVSLVGVLDVWVVLEHAVLAVCSSR